MATDRPGGPTLEVRNLVTGYGDLDVLHGVDLVVRAGEVVAIIGPNGAGKSTLLKAVFGLLALRSGDVLLRGHSIANRPTEEIVRAGAAYVPQVANVFPRLTVRENLELGAFLHPAEVVADGVRRVLSIFPALQGKMHARVATLSGGQRQMVAMGRALMAEPAILLLDEPTAGLAPNLADGVFRHVREIAAGGTPVLLVEQNARRALASSDRGYVLDAGCNKFDGRGQDLLADENVGKLYLGA